ncbi:uncharacterized protein PFL1_03953 [Pseudozyma flocculosa PF-1]|uniref:Transcription factor IIIC 90kDa subunit N-terminal domain-containing protein n=1 Tax=Pseudozyma flocculosa PF-1 TaxID=1277687 RepID=A0A061H9E7_9BASI|nr:uncharacterized protein PFL1_03953 [Pseudozyma flocculosa PF-1]EPQ28650.1 hypothetical protein PFL1_03953 [Pseudozyma flocculosa PF-1]
MTVRIAPSGSPAAGQDQAKGKARAVDNDDGDIRNGCSDGSATTAGNSLVLLASATLKGQSGRLTNLQWSSGGQALVPLKQSLVILTPCLGLHPQLFDSVRLSDLEAHPNWWDKFDHLIHSIEYRPIYESDPTVRTRSAVSKDYSAIHASQLEQSWQQAEWSPPGLGVAGSSLIAALSHEHDLYIIGAAKNPFGADWRVLHAVDAEPIRRHVRRERQQASEAGAPSVPAFFAPDVQTGRLESRAGQFLCAAWTEAIPPDRTRPGSAGDASEVQALLIAGTRSGHLALWECSNRASAPRLATCSRTGSWDVLGICVGPWQAGRVTGTMSCRIVTHDRQRVAIWTLERARDRLDIKQASELPPPLPGRMISVWKWFGGLLVYATTGEVHVFDADNGTTRTFELSEGGRDDCDPLRPAASIRPKGSGSCIIALQDSSRYLVPLDINAGAPAGDTLVPLAAPVARGYVPLLSEVQPAYDALQRLHGEAAESSSASPVDALEASIRSYDSVASMGLTVSGSSRYNLWLRSPVVPAKDARTRAVELLAAALASVEHLDAPTVARIRHVLAHYHVSSSPVAFADGLGQVIDQATDGLEDALLRDGPTSDDATTTVSRDHALRRGQACLYVALWLQRERGDAAPAGTARNVDFLRSLLFVRHLADSMAGLVDEVEPASSMTKDEARRDATTVTRLAAAAHAMLSSGGAEPSRPRTSRLQGTITEADAVLARLGVSLGAIQKQWDETLRSDGTLQAGEECAACEAPLSLQVDAAKGTVEWARCVSGHVWPRCGVSLAPLVSVGVRACSGCWTKSLLHAVPTRDQAAMDVEPGVEPLSSVLFRGPGETTCWACGCTWVPL